MKCHLCSLEHPLDMNAPLHGCVQALLEDRGRFVDALNEIDRLMVVMQPPLTTMNAITRIVRDTLGIRP